MPTKKKIICLNLQTSISAIYYRTRWLIKLGVVFIAVCRSGHKVKVFEVFATASIVIVIDVTYTLYLSAFFSFYIILSIIT